MRKERKRARPRKNQPKQRRVGKLEGQHYGQLRKHCGAVGLEVFAKAGFGLSSDTEQALLMDPAQKVNVQNIERVDKTNFRITKSKVVPDTVWSGLSVGSDEAISGMRLAWLPPFMWAVEGIDATKPREIQTDVRGMLSDMKNTHVRFKNICPQDVRVVCNSPRSLYNSGTTVDFRDGQHDFIIRPGQTIGVTFGWGSEMGTKVPMLNEVTGVYDPEGSDKKHTWNLYTLMDFVVVSPKVNIYSNTEMASETEVVEVSVENRYVANLCRMTQAVSFDRDPFVMLPMSTFKSIMVTEPLDVDNAKVFTTVGGGRAVVPKWVSLRDNTTQHYIRTKLGTDGGLPPRTYCSLYWADQKGNDMGAVFKSELADKRYGIFIPGLTTDGLDTVGMMFRYDYRDKRFYLWDEALDEKHQITNIRSNYPSFVLASQAVLCYDSVETGMQSFDTIIKVLAASLEVVRVLSVVSTLF